MTTSITFEVPGLPQTAGSKRAFPIKTSGQFTGRNIVVDANPKSKDWKITVAHAAKKAMDASNRPFENPLLEGPLEVRFIFRMPRPSSHYRKDKSLKPKSPHRPITRPDLLKLARAIEDAMMGIVYRDDSQIVIEHLEKFYACRPGCKIEVAALDQPSSALADKDRSKKERELAL